LLWTGGERISEGTMSDERDDKDDPAEELKQGLGHLWRAARGMATNLKKEVDRTNFGKALDDAGREFARAATNVVDRLSTEIGGKKPERPFHEEPPEPAPAPKKDDEDDEFDGVKPIPRDKRGPTPDDPGFRIMIDDDDEKKPK
jgi:hypothetical protein